MTDNIIHLVLARMPDAPPGMKGISLFLVPKFLVNADGSLAGATMPACVRLEHKLGIHGSPTAVMTFGDKGGAIGTLVGDPMAGSRRMLTMMIDARFSVGVPGVGISERACQQARAFAHERMQGAANRRGGSSWRSPSIPT